MEPPTQCPRRPGALGVLQVLSDEILCRILDFLEPRDVGILTCVSSAFYIFCNDEPLWMKLCLQNHDRLIVYKGTWRQTTLEKLTNLKEAENAHFKHSLHFEGFSSLFLYRRWYRCNVMLGSFSFDGGAIQRRSGLSNTEFTAVYDGKKPVLLTDLTIGWAASDTWTLDKLVHAYGEVTFKVSQNQGRKILMRLDDYTSYMTLQHDEDPLYIFDAKFGEVAPGLLQDYTVPNLFEDDLLGVLDNSKRPPFRWLVIGPTRSGASWHVDPALTSAWNTLLVGRKRWALYPPGRVPPAVVVHVDEEDGEVNFDGPSSLQWWMDVYPFLKDKDKPLECTQLPGETIFVPSGWWHCVLNIDTSVAVTQNFVNSVNFELVCLDMAPGYHHRGIARAGRQAFKEYFEMTNVEAGVENARIQPTGTDFSNAFDMDGLASLIEDNPVNFLSHSCKSSYLEAGHMREWLRRLWVVRPDLEKQIWKGASLALDASTWLDRVIGICNAHGLPNPGREEQLSVGDGSNPVFLIGNYAVKLYVDDDGGDTSIYALGSELHFYSQLAQNGSSLRDAVPALVASGILHQEGETYKAVFWDGMGDCPSQSDGCHAKKRHLRDIRTYRLKTRWAQTVINPMFLDDNQEHLKKAGNTQLTRWPYIVTRRCNGENFGNMLSGEWHRSIDHLFGFTWMLWMTISWLNHAY